MQVYASTAAEWKEALDYFADPETVRLMRLRGLSVTVIEPESWTVKVESVFDAEEFLTWLKSI